MHGIIMARVIDLRSVALCTACCTSGDGEHFSDEPPSAAQKQKIRLLLFPT